MIILLSQHYRWQAFSGFIQCPTKAPGQQSTLVSGVSNSNSLANCGYAAFTPTTEGLFFRIFKVAEPDLQLIE